MRTFGWILAGLLWSSSAWATTIVPADLGELTRDAAAIARGRVAAVESRWSEDRRGIETLVTVDVDGYLKGSLGPSVQFLVPGGRLGRYRSVFVGAPQFAVDDRVVVFLAARGPELAHLVGFSQGVYRVRRSRDTGEWQVAPSPLFPAAVATPVIRGDASRQPMPLPEFERRVRALAEGR
ncbi:MAG TPA: hypothetical protein VL309_11350 [Vicinamibacterales bacterium]|jgi:hypothetical protein|nr:hypothetical protein [Vicinamibacterales bacterium]